MSLASPACAVPEVPEYAVEDVPFAARGRCAPETTVLVRVRSRSRWKREIDELMAVCDEAARRASLASEAVLDGRCSLAHSGLDGVLGNGVGLSGRAHKIWGRR